MYDSFQTLISRTVFNIDNNKKPLKDHMTLRIGVNSALHHRNKLHFKMKIIHNID